MFVQRMGTVCAWCGALLVSVSTAAAADPAVIEGDLSLSADNDFYLQLADQDDESATGRESWFGDESGFISGLPGYEGFVKPVGMPLYFEDPFITTDLRLLYIYHTIPGSSVLRGGQVHVAAVQARLALTERLAFIATKDGYSWVDSGITPSGDGWNDIALGLKYAFISKPEERFLLTGGFRYEFSNGSRDAWQGGDSGEVSPFISVAKGWDKWNFIGAVSGRIATDDHDATHSLVWNLHLDYELTDEFRPLVELHGIHWLSDADRLPTSEDYLDVGSLGA